MADDDEPRRPRPGSAAWWLARGRRPQRASTLNVRRIVEAAVQLLDEDGLDAFTMRRLADRLGTGHGSLYRHFESREAMLVAVHDDVIGQTLGGDPPGANWLERTTNGARGLWLVLKGRPYLAEIWRTTEQLGPNAMHARERMLALALDGGLDEQTAAHTYQTVLHFTIGLALVEQGLSFRSHAERDATRDWFGDQPEDTYPVTRALARHLVEGNLDREFELGLSAILTGVRALQSGSPAA